MKNYIFLLEWNNGNDFQCDTLCYGYNNIEDAKKELPSIIAEEMECSWISEHTDDELIITQNDTQWFCKYEDKFTRISIQEVEIH